MYLYFINVSNVLPKLAYPLAILNGSYWEWAFYRAAFRLVPEYQSDATRRLINNCFVSEGVGCDGCVGFSVIFFSSIAEVLGPGDMRRKRKSKRPYRALEVNKVCVASVLERSESERLVVAIDVAKEKVVAAVMDEHQEVLVTVKWSHPLAVTQNRPYEVT